ncbi:cell division protein ZapA [Novosphingobium sp. FGD1]|jgi:cell division protein ZapA|uniref:Cell division protein ZapA n=1 Tax=Novosphingobium silvae TaxID=2692619 RepID=A0A7X4GEP2_9SPHN|nr:cell division protein ZapA [Novosphingobium silvae]MYL97025.1 cell division protein ZapA [Novosphingobium silvae]
MGNVTLSIGGRSFTLASANGEEAHVEALGRLIDEKVRAAGVSGQTETRMLLFASLMLADELHELRSRPAPEPVPEPVASPIEAPRMPREAGERLARIAARIENLASLLEGEKKSA